jgi:hypothetical protein
LNQNFDALVFLPDRFKLQHYFRENDKPDNRWEKAQIVNVEHDVAGPATILQAPSIGNSKRSFDVVVPEIGGLAHYWHDNSIPSSPWIRTGVSAPGVKDASALVRSPENERLEVVARLGKNLFHYWRTPNLIWHRTETPITRTAEGAPASIYSSYGNLELVVQEGTQLVHYWRDHLAFGQPWKYGGGVAPRTTGPAGFVQRPFGFGEHKDFEVAVPVDDRIEFY